MKNLVFVIICLALIAAIIFSLPNEKKLPVSPLPSVTDEPNPTSILTNRKEQVSLFVPYWSLSKGISDDKHYDQLIYFGIAPAAEGINRHDSGYTQLRTFIQERPEGVSSVLAIRMLDSDTNFAVLKDPTKQRSLAKEVAILAKENNFDGILLDLEVSALPFDSLIKQVNALAQNFSKEAKSRNLTFSMALYGDTFYRIRPFEVKTLAGYTDHIMVMAYDFSKANGNPGPNFPLSGRDLYGYDYVKLADNFLQAVPAEKLTVIQGLYGYDWQVDEKNISQKIGKARSLSEIQLQILAKCTQLHCESKRDSASVETTVTYIDTDGNTHVVWYEDADSIKRKQQYLRSRGITSYSLWANSYF